MAERNLIDWETIEREYRAGQLSLREIARDHGVSDGAIRKKAKVCGWERDLSERVRVAANAEVVRRQVRADGTRAPATERQIVEAARDRGADAIEGHLARAARLKAQADRVAELLDDYLNGDSERSAAAASILCLGKGDGLTATFRAMAEVAERVQKLERQSLNLDEKDKAAPAVAITFDRADSDA